MVRILPKNVRSKHTFLLNFLTHSKYILLNTEIWTNILLFEEKTSNSVLRGLSYSLSAHQLIALGFLTRTWA